ncbi:hypothetical protein [Algoriphagus boritolerans]|uniref:Uncharacterized protein n=1 Tax=Algoriphagus boritolerans DSM 17298 = JCM 18970 TaxID=1120964 RepID=A0A1H6ADM4_9BACT|nr:hypothetical protein [Algoriphagus boritolerans]SEG46581.1 hypothetical protein SAMN03080598_04070 [Algoriphagus boritolerans DSM 17298 = JCM 18970]
MNFNKKLEELLGIGLDDYPGSDYSLIEEHFYSWSRHPRFISRKKPTTPIFDLFEEVEVVTSPYLYNRMMTLIAPEFEPAQIKTLENLVRELAEIYGADRKGMLWLLEEEIEEILLAKWEGRVWEFDKYDEIHDIFLLISSEKRIELTIKETGNLLDFLDD